MKSKYVNKTDATKADHYNDLVDDVQSLETAHEHLASRVESVRPDAGPFLAQITQEAGGGEYDQWQEVYRNAADGAWEALPGGRTHTTTGGSLFAADDQPDLWVGASSQPVVVIPTFTAEGVLQYRFFHLARIIPITLSQTGGVAGNKTTKCSFTYTVTHAVGTVELGTGIDPTAGNHKWQRPAVGLMLAADSGYAYYNSSGNLVINIINEMLDAAAC